MKKIKTIRTIVRVSKVKLPRKRKKACIKAIGKVQYLGIIYVNELSFEDNWDKLDRKFPKYYHPYNSYLRGTVKEYW